MIELTFSYTEEDLLTRELFSASHNKNIRSQRLRDFVILSTLLVVGIFFNFYRENTQLARSMCGILLVWLLVGNYFLKGYYKAHYKGQVRKKKQQFLHQDVVLQLDEQQMVVRSNDIESKLLWKAFVRIIEINDYVFFQLDGQQYLMIPTTNQDEHLPDQISDWAKMNNVPYSRNFDWKW